MWLASGDPEGPCGIVETQLAEVSGARERGLLALNRSRVYRVRPCAPPRDHVHCTCSSAGPSGALVPTPNRNTHSADVDVLYMWPYS